MRMMHKLALGAACVAAMYGVLQVSLPPQIDAVHNTSNGQPWLVLMRHLPLTQQGKIDWWDSNRAMLMVKYKIPADDFDLTFMEWNGEYVADPGRPTSFFEDSDAFDLLCFEDMNAKDRCIEKHSVMNVGRRSDGGVRFTVEGPTGWATYVRAPDSDVLRLRPD